LTDKDIDDWNHILETLDPAGKTSMLQDAEAGRRMELDLFADTVIALAENTESKRRSTESSRRYSKDCLQKYRKKTNPLRG
jgi:hypothetical protein